MYPMDLVIPGRIRQKLASKHGVNEDDIRECFANLTRQHKFLLDTREDHQTDPPTRWFISETDFGRQLKIVFMVDENKSVIIKSAFEPNDEEIRIYCRCGISY